MPSIRIGFSTDFVLVNEQVGINTTLPTALLDVRGQIRADRTTGSGGITTLTTYDGFLQSRQTVGTNISIASTTKGNLNSISGEIIVDGEVTVSSGTPLTGGRLDSLTVTGTFDLPSGGSANREVTPEKGSTRFNQDLGQLEFYTGYEWRTVSSYDGSGRGRGVIGGGFNGSAISGIEYLNISTLGNTQDFGNLTVGRFQHGSCSSSTRGLWCGGVSPSATNVIDYVTIASAGNAIDFGDSTVTLSQRHGGLSSSTRGIFNSGLGPTGVTDNVIEYVEISTIGNALDFGDLSSARFDLATNASPTRGIFASGFFSPSNIAISVIDFITISSKGNASYFGDISLKRRGVAGASGSTRGIFAGGATPDPTVNIIDYITIASSGNAIDFGKLTETRNAVKGTASNTRAIFIGGQTPANSNVIDYVMIASTGNAIDFGDLSIAGQQRAALSDSHGGLGGF